MSKVIDIKIDWSVFDEVPEYTVECHCGAIFKSHAKYIGGTINRMISKKLCPECNTNYRLRRVSSDPEVMTIKR